MKDLKHFIFWCNKVLPLAYDNSLSYYEVLCKCVNYINDMIDNMQIVGNELDELKRELAEVQKWINEFEPQILDTIVAKYLASMVFPELNGEGYIVYNIPMSWANIEFRTTGLDIQIEAEPEYGHLVLYY